MSKLSLGAAPVVPWVKIHCPSPPRSQMDLFLGYTNGSLPEQAQKSSSVLVQQFPWFHNFHVVNSAQGGVFFLWLTESIYETSLGWEPHTKIRGGWIWGNPVLPASPDIPLKESYLTVRLYFQGLAMAMFCHWCLCQAISHFWSTLPWYKHCFLFDTSEAVVSSA